MISLRAMTVTRDSLSLFRPLRIEVFLLVSMQCGNTSPSKWVTSWSLKTSLTRLWKSIRFSRWKHQITLSYKDLKGILNNGSYSGSLVAFKHSSNMHSESMGLASCSLQMIFLVQLSSRFLLLCCWRTMTRSAHMESEWNYQSKRSLGKQGNGKRIYSKRNLMINLMKIESERVSEREKTIQDPPVGIIVDRIVRLWWLFFAR